MLVFNTHFKLSYVDCSNPLNDLHSFDSFNLYYSLFSIG
ncbi:hypothetical protein X564_14815 [Pseudoalteromonas agarivorans]|nr:hypothetical protein X564_14815 [Pseudoalteromonas agarivorans]